jgi:hypothetical protein
MATDATNMGSGASRSSRRHSEVSIVKHPPRDYKTGKNRRILDRLSDSIKPEIDYCVCSSLRGDSGDDALGFGVPEHRLLLPVRLDGQLDRNHCRCSQLGIAAQLAVAARGLFSWLSLVAAYTLVLGAAADLLPEVGAVHAVTSPAAVGDHRDADPAPRARAAFTSVGQSGRRA